MNRKQQLLIILTLLALILSGCKTLGRMSQKESEKALQITLRGYETTLRWGQPSQAYSFLSKDLQEQTTLPSGLDNIQVTGYQLLQRPDLVSEKKAAQVVQIRYVFKDRQVEKHLIDKQLWEYDKEKNKWSRINPIPLFK